MAININRNKLENLFAQTFAGLVFCLFTSATWLVLYSFVITFFLGEMKKQHIIGFVFMTIVFGVCAAIGYGARLAIKKEQVYYFDNTRYAWASEPIISFNNPKYLR